MSIPALRELLGRLGAATQALAALGVELDARAGGREVDPSLRPHLDDVLAALGAREALEGVSAAELAPLVAEVRMNLLHASKVALGVTGAWKHTEAELLVATGKTSAGFAFGLKNTVAPRLEGLSERLAAPGGAFLDVGVGVAGLALAMTRLWPSLRVVGIDPWPPSLALARENVRAARADDRVELRAQAVEELEDREAFDLAWLPTVFISAAIVPTALARIHQALRPGGWILVALNNPGDDALSAALARFRTVTWGGRPFTTGELEAALVAGGYADVSTLPIAPGSPAIVIVARRAS